MLIFNLLILRGLRSVLLSLLHLMAGGSIPEIQKDPGKAVLKLQVSCLAVPLIVLLLLLGGVALCLEGLYCAGGRGCAVAVGWRQVHAQLCTCTHARACVPIAACASSPLACHH